MDTQDQPQRLKDVISSYAGKEGALVPVLQEAQRIYGYLPAEAERLISDGLGIPLARVIGVRSFYAYFYSTKVGKYVIRVCKSSSCHVNRSAATLKAFEEALDIKPGETTADGKFYLETCGCLGICDLAPALIVNDQIFGPVNPIDVASILSRFA